MSTQQKALLLDKPKGDFSVGLKNISEPASGEIQVQVHAAALNPVDWIVRALGIIITEYPAVVGYDAAGVITKLGEGVTNFAVGDKVISCGQANNRAGCFQQYAIAPADLAAKLPSNVSFDEGSTLPLTLSTAAVGLYGKKSAEGTSGAELYPPWEEGGKDKYAGEPIVIVGAGSNVGCHVVQLAKLSGFSPIIVTASKAKEAYLKSCGATHIIDRYTPTADMPAAVRSITNKAVKVVYDCVSQADTENAGYDLLASGGTLVIFPNFVMDKSKITPDKDVRIVNGNFHGPAQRDIGRKLYLSLTQMLEAGDIKPSSTIEVLPGGLAGIPKGLERLQTGQLTSAKFVARPQETA